MEYPETPEKGRYNDYEELTGIGGWLAGFLVWLCLSIVISLFSGIVILGRHDIGALFASERGPILIVSIAIQAVFTALITTIIILLIKHKVVFRTLYVVTVVADLVASIILSILLNDGLGITALPGWSSIYSIGIKVGWIIYLYKSKRVENTCLPDDTETSGTRNDFI